MTSSLPSGFDGVTLPSQSLSVGYAYRVTRYADVILRDAFPDHWSGLLLTLETFRIDLETDILRPGGNRTDIAARFDAALRNRGWARRT